MRLRFIPVLLTSTFLGAWYARAADPEERAIRQLVEQYVNARNAQDATATRALFTSDADQLVSSGEWRRGIDALINGAMASSRREAGKSSIEIESIRFVEPDVAIADGRYETFSKESGASRKMWTTLVLKRTQTGWRITAIRNMLPSGPASAGSR